MRHILTRLAKGETAMIKTAILGTTLLFGASAPSVPLAIGDSAAAEQIGLTLPAADAIVAQFSYLEISHGDDGFELSITDTTDIFLDVEFPGDLHIRIGF